jgi:hypothetical protein
MMLSAATVRRPAVVLGAILSVLTLTGPAWGQSLGSVGSAVNATAESVEPVTKAVTGTTSKAAEPVTTTVAKVTQPVRTAPSSSGKSSSPGTKTATQATQPVTPTVPAATSTVKKATKSVAPVAQASEPVMREAASTVDTVASSETQALLGLLVETIDGHAEELTGWLLDSGTGLGRTVRAVTGALASSQGTLQTSSQVWDGGESSGYAQTEAATQAASGTAARTPAPRGAMPFVAVAGDGASLAPPLLTAPATASDGARPVRQASTSPHAPPQPNAPASPASALGSSTGFSAASAVLAGLIALALSALLGRLLPWSDTIRPLAFVSPPERPG